MSTDDTQLRQLIRLIMPARALRAELEKALGLEIYEGVANAGVRTYRGLHRSVAAIVDDPYVAALALDEASGSTDQQKVAEIGLLAAQLLAYLEAQTGLVGIGGGGDSHVQYGTHVVIQGINAVPPSTVDKMLDVAGGKGKGAPPAGDADAQ
ncbi:MAG: hypothetical protein AB1505_31010 [Candidatus Latescibacterota bacterium]